MPAYEKHPAPPGDIYWGRGQQDVSAGETAAGCRNPYFASEEKATDLLAVAAALWHRKLFTFRSERGVRRPG